MRREFPRAVKVAVIKRAARDGVIYCESCSLPAKKWQIDHVRADGLLGEPVIENAMLICESCYSIKNPADTSAIAKAKRREAIHLRADTAPRQKIQSRGFPKSGKQPRIDKSALVPLQRRNPWTGEVY